MTLKDRLLSASVKQRAVDVKQRLIAAGAAGMLLLIAGAVAALITLGIVLCRSFT